MDVSKPRAFTDFKKKKLKKQGVMSTNQAGKEKVPILIQVSWQQVSLIVVFITYLLLALFCVTIY